MLAGLLSGTGRSGKVLVGWGAGRVKGIRGLKTVQSGAGAEKAQPRSWSEQLGFPSPMVLLRTCTHIWLDQAQIKLILCSAPPYVN